MTTQLLVASRGTRYADGTCLVTWPLPPGTVVKSIDVIELRYLASVNPELHVSIGAGSSIRIEVPGSGPGAPDSQVSAALPIAVQRANGEVSVTLDPEVPVPAPSASFPWTQISVRWAAFPDQPVDSTGGLTTSQKLYVEV